MQTPTAKSATNMMWFTEENVPDPAPDEISCEGWKILVRPIPNAPKSKGGIIIPDSTLDVIDLIRSVGRVVKLGPLAYSRQDMLVEGQKRPWCKVGDYILYGRYNGAKFSYGGVKLLWLNDDDCLGVIKDPAKINA